MILVKKKNKLNTQLRDLNTYSASNNRLKPINFSKYTFSKVQTMSLIGVTFLVIFSKLKKTISHEIKIDIL